MNVIIMLLITILSEDKSEVLQETSIHRNNQVSVAVNSTCLIPKTSQKLCLLPRYTNMKFEVNVSQKTLVSGCFLSI